MLGYLQPMHAMATIYEGVFRKMDGKCHHKKVTFLLDENVALHVIINV